MFSSRSWLRRWHAIFTPRRVPLTRTRLRLDTLEDRSVPAILVINANDGGSGSLREAITAANATPGLDTIEFAIPGSGPHAIDLLSALPAITDAVLVDGWSQPGFAGAPLVQLRNGSGTVATGLDVAAAGTTVRGLSITQMTGSGISVSTGNVWIAGNYIGVDPTGTLDRGNGTNGVLVTGVSGVTVGTNSDGANDTIERNVISGNDFSGVNLINAGGNTIRGNFIGTNAAGTGAIPNSGGGAGIVVQGSSSGNLIGGSLASDRNVISGNATSGVWLLNASVTKTTVQGNFIGLNAAGTGSLGNALHGVRITGSSGNTVSDNVVSGNAQTGVFVDGANGTVISGNLIGTDAAGGIDRGNGLNGVLLINGSSGNTVAGNVISGNDFSGVNLISAGGNTIRGNLIGTNASGSAAIPNSGGGAGVIVQGGSSGNLIGGSLASDRNVISGNAFSGVWLLGTGVTNTAVRGNSIGTNASGTGSLGNSGPGVRIEGASGNQIGGTAPGAGNLIAHNGAAGVVVLSGTGNGVRGNSIFANVGLGIDLGGDGSTPNDPGDADVGPNGRQNFPTLSAVSGSGNGVTIAGTLDSTPNATFTLDFFSNPASTPSTVGESRTYLGSLVVTTGENGKASFSVSLTAPWFTGLVATATATAADGSTSEVSAGLSGPTISPPVADAGPDTDSDEGDLVQFDGTGSADPVGRGLTYTWDFGDGQTGTGPQPTHAYLDEGVYTATLVVRDAHGVEDSDTVVVTVANVAPTPSIDSVSSPLVEGTAITVTGSATDPGSNDTLTFAWEVFKDGTAYATGSGTSFDFTPDDNGSYRIVLTASDEDGGSNATEQTVSVANADPVPSIDSVSSPLVEGTAITATGSATDPAGANDTLTFTWSVTKNGSPYGSPGTGTSYTFTPDDNGSYVVSLTVSDEDGGSATVSRTLDVGNAAPTPSIDDLSTPRVEGTAITATGSATDPAGANDTLTFAWEVFKNGSPYATGSGTSVSFTPDDNGSYRIVLTASDEDGGSASAEQTVSVANVDPQNVNAGPDQAVGAGTIVTLSGIFTDPGTADTHTLVWSVVASNGQSIPDGSGPTFSFVPTAAGTYTVTFTVTDDDGGVGSDQVVVTVTGGGVSVNIFGPAAGAQGEPVAFTSSHTNSGPADTYRWSVTLNGSLVDLTGYVTTEPTFSFVPVRPGSYQVSLTVVTASGSGAATHALGVTAPPGAVLLSGGQLVVRGTAGGDLILVEGPAADGSVNVWLNWAPQQFAGVSEVVIYANGGNDLVVVSGDFHKPVTAFGGSGSDFIVGGGGFNVLVGGSGNDVLIGGRGRDILIGGTGSDILFGGGRSDILIAGWTTYDTNLAALTAIRTEWGSSHSYEERVANLSGTGSTGANGDAVLKHNVPGATVFDDTSTDYLFGGWGRDWYFFDSRDHRGGCG